jgi:glutamate-1-semialdehyde 2,1-aminomutase
MRIPGTTGTFSKGPTQWPGVGKAERGKGCKLWIDGKEYIDLVMGLTPVILGYCNEEVDDAVKRQIDKGSIFTLPSELEEIVAEKICNMVPNAEMVRFGKNGSDATSGAVRLARAITGRDHIAQCGYHGWQDWSIGVAGRNLGVPSRVSELTHPFKYNNLASLEAIFDLYPNQIACVIMEPVNKEEPKDDFLNAVKNLCHKNNALFILDEVVTGFRIAKGGAQECYGVDADLVCLGKAIANGYPLSAIAGKKEYMEYMTRIHYSFTFSGDCIALAAAEKTLEIIDRENLSQHFVGMTRLIESNTAIRFSGHPAWPHLIFNSPEERMNARQRCFENGLLIMDTFNYSLGGLAADIANILNMIKNTPAKYHDRMCHPDNECRPEFDGVGYRCTNREHWYTTKGKPWPVPSFQVRA